MSRADFTSMDEPMKMGFSESSTMSLSWAPLTKVASSGMTSRRPAEAEFLFQQKLGDLRFGEGDGGVDEEFAGGVAGRTEVDAVGATLKRDRGNGEPLSSGGVPFE